MCGKTNVFLLVLQRASASTSPRESGGTPEAVHGMWIGKDATAAELVGPQVSSQELHSLNGDSLSQSASAATSHEEEELETRELS